MIRILPEAFIHFNMEESIVVRGGNRLVGTVTPVPNKNSIVAALPACILSKDVVTYRNVPKSTDVVMILEMLKSLGAKVDDKDFNNLQINCRDVNSYEVDMELGSKIRASILFAGPLLSRFGKAKIPLPGGCQLGERSLASHIDSFRKAGVKAKVTKTYIYFEKAGAPSDLIWQAEASVTSTENVALFASGIADRITIIDAASEPHVCDLLNLLSSMGAGIEGIGSSKIIVSGRAHLRGSVFVPGPDFIDIAGYIVAAALTFGEIRIKDSNIPQIMNGIIEWFRKFNVTINKDGEDLVAIGPEQLSIDLKDGGFPMASSNLPKFVPRPWPGFPVDALPIVVALSCKLDGRILIHNWMYETGLEFVKSLNLLGGNFQILDSQKVIASGPMDLKGGRVESPGVIQGCMALFLASLADRVETAISGVGILKRRNPYIFDIYKKLGADIRVL